MKKMKKLQVGLLIFAISSAMVSTVAIPVYAQNEDIDSELNDEEFWDDESWDDEDWDDESWDDEADDEEEAEEEETEQKLSLYCSQTVADDSLEYLTTVLSKKDKKIKNFYDCTVENQDGESVKSKISYKVTKADKYLAFSNNTLTIKKGITAGTHKIKVQVTVTATGYKGCSDTKDITVKIKKPRTSGTISETAYCDIGNIWDLPVDVAGTYKITISGPGAKKLNVTLTSDGKPGKTIKSGSKVKLNPKKQALYIVPKKMADESYKITIKLKKI